jgi:hypothetical protein
MARGKIVKDLDEIPQRDLKYIKNPDLWANIYVPLKRTPANGIGIECAYMTGSEPVIRHGNIWAVSDSDREERFESHEAILKAGWRVD